MEIRKNENNLAISRNIKAHRSSYENGENGLGNMGSLLPAAHQVKYSFKKINTLPFHDTELF